MLNKLQNFLFLTTVTLLLVVPFSVYSEVDCSIDLEGKSDAELELALKKCEAEIAEQEALLNAKQKESVTIERDIQILDSKISKTQADIRAKEIKIYKLKDDIFDKKETVSELNAKTERINKSLIGLVKRTNELDSFSVLEAVLSQDSLSEFFIDFDDFGTLESELQNNLVAIRQVKAETQTAQELLEEQEQKERALKLTKEKEKKTNRRV